MVLLKAGCYAGDYELPNLMEIITLLDGRVDEINALVKEVADPETEGLCDKGEYYVGTGFVIMQRYLTYV